MGTTYLDRLPSEIQKDINEIAEARNNYDAVVSVIKDNLVWEQNDENNSRRYLELGFPGCLWWGETEYLFMSSIHPSYKYPTWLFIKFTSPSCAVEAEVMESLNKVTCTKPNRVYFA